jgi:predicted small secreted protein
MRAILNLMIVGAFLAVAGCETVQGVGRDVQTGGEAITGTSQDVQEEM